MESGMDLQEIENNRRSGEYFRARNFRPYFAASAK